jgi:hypothetical protein
MKNLIKREVIVTFIHFLKSSFLLLIFLVLSVQLSAQVAINTNGTKPDTSAMLDIQDTTRGVLIPRMTHAQRLLIYQPAKGLLVYQVDAVGGSLPGFYYQSVDPTLPAQSGEPNAPVWIQLGSYAQTANIAPPLTGGPVLGGGTLSMPAANATTNGYLTFSDWNKFTAKDSIAPGNTTQYFRGDKTWQTLSSNVVPEGSTNLYFSDARVLGTTLDGLSINNEAITISDSIISGFGKVQGQINFQQSSINTLSSSSHPPLSLGVLSQGLELNGLSQVLSLPLASSSITGALSNANWETFNSKENGIATSDPNKFFSWDKTWRTIDYSMINGSPDLSVYALKTTSITGNNGLTGGGSFAGNTTIGHGLKSWVDKATLSGPTVVSNLTIDTYGHPTDWTTRDLTPASISAEPAFTILPVNKGGTGVSAMSTYTLIAGGTTSSSPLQQLGPGSSGQLLQSNGNGTLPSWFYPTYISGNQNIQLSGDVSGSGTTSINTTLASSGVTSGTYGNSGASIPYFTVDSKGRLTYASSRTLAASDIGAEPTITAGTSAQYYRGDKTWQTSGTAFILNQSASAQSASFKITGTGVVTNNASTAGALQGINTFATSTGTGVVGVGNNATPSLLGIGAGGQFFGTSCGVYGYATNTSGNRYGGYFTANPPSGSNSNYTYVGLYHSAVGSGTTFYDIYGSGTVGLPILKPSGEQASMFYSASPEVLFSDYGAGQLQSGFCHIELDPVFVNTIYADKSNPLKIFIQLEGDCLGVYVTNKTTHGFDVKELQQGTSNVPFSWSVVASRADSRDASGNITSKYQGLRFPGSPKVSH